MSPPYFPIEPTELRGEWTFATVAEGEQQIADYAVELARRAGTRSVMLFHHRHDRTDDALDGLAQRLGGGSTPAVSVAAESTVLEL